MANKFLNILSNNVRINKNKLSLNISDLDLDNNTTYNIVPSENVIKDLHNNPVTLPEFKFTTTLNNSNTGDDPNTGDTPIINAGGITIEFTASTGVSNLNLFDKYGQSTIDTSNYVVNINGTDTNQAINLLTFATDDKIIIKKKDDVKYFPVFNCDQKNYIKSIDAPLPLMSLDFTNDATDFNNCFRNCINLTSVPVDLFKYNTSATNFSGYFNNCPNLTSIPTDLFKYNTSVIDFNYCFYGCSGLTSIPEDLFKYNTAVTNFWACFASCANLTSIPENLFRYNTAVTNFSWCFQYCYELTSIPADLFRYNTAVTEFGGCFYGCSNITSSLPELWVSHPSVAHTWCFAGCTKASNYTDAQAAGWV